MTITKFEPKPRVYEAMQVDLRILRFNPERDEKPHWEAYTVEADPKRTASSTCSSGSSGSRTRR